MDDKLDQIHGNGPDAHCQIFPGAGTRWVARGQVKPSTPQPPQNTSMRCSLGLVIVPGRTSFPSASLVSWVPYNQIGLTTANETVIVSGNVLNRCIFVIFF